MFKHARESENQARIYTIDKNFFLLHIMTYQNGSLKKTLYRDNLSTSSIVTSAGGNKPSRIFESYYNRRSQSPKFISLQRIGIKSQNLAFTLILGWGIQ